jgi:hypothetical protein
MVCVIKLRLLYQKLNKILAARSRQTAEVQKIKFNFFYEKNTIAMVSGAWVAL